LLPFQRKLFSFQGDFDLINYSTTRHCLLLNDAFFLDRNRHVRHLFDQQFRFQWISIRARARGGETEADINTEGREKNLERPREKSVTGVGRGNGRSQASHRWPITPDNKHNLILYSFHLALRRSNPSPGIISAISWPTNNTPMTRAHRHPRSMLHRIVVHTHTHTHTRARARAYIMHTYNVAVPTCFCELARYMQPANTFVRYIFMLEMVDIRHYWIWLLLWWPYVVPAFMFRYCH